MDADTLASITLLCGLSGLVFVFASVADGIYRSCRVPVTRVARDRHRHYDRVGYTFACVGGMLLMAFVAGVARLAGLI